ncbi:hypothetical protein JNUCC31_23445 [Paenibacillus sp. JNUCC31]|uniref:hypothetical protein n=1 Tax=Paenibacillus sp. JNUCC-31 TaxID=2777983 RepID=UPI0017853308|nr:hypothetical protein [Paenibacillus sp. JNUCC-31]QOS77691.1 hypothetical protein JNUCC31_23445 [Paenibacillus sp. JNUCC-31]
MNKMKSSFSYDPNMIRKLPVVMGLVTLVVMLIITNPTRSDFYTWLESEHGIYVSYDVNAETTFTQITNGEEKSLILSSGHTQRVGIFTTYDELFTDIEGNDTKIKAIGVMNMFFKR